MTRKEKKKYIGEIRERYANSRKSDKSVILNHFCQVFNYNCKHAIHILNGKFHLPDEKKRGPRPKYSDPEVLSALKEIWTHTDKMCSKKLKRGFPRWLPFLNVSREIQNLLLQMSPSTIDVLLRSFRN